jgi:hypothetical protein
MKIRFHLSNRSRRAHNGATLAAILFTFATAVRADDPRTNSWFTTYAGRYARIYTTDANKAAGDAVTTWTNGSLMQSLPAYSGAQAVYSSANWVYVRSTGLASYTMGPWYLNAAHTQLFPNFPVNQQTLFRIPRSTSVPTAKTATGGGPIGCFVDGVAMFNSWDAFYWNGTEDASGGGMGYWNRDAFVNEGVTFDAGYAHQQNTGTYHYHADPIGLRYLLGDHVDFDEAAKVYSESTNMPTQHSPILAWTADGSPLYGPYGYSTATNANSSLRRMVSGYVIRDGQYGTSNLTANGRDTIPQWAVRLYNVSSNQTGPAVSASYPLGRYMEDNDYLGDHGYTQGVDFDLDEYNGCWCVTPEFPNGVYAYFVAISAGGLPVFPYNIGRGYYGSPTGGSVSSITEPVATNFLGETNLTSLLNAPAVNNGTVTLTWSALEGGSYQIEAATNLSTWTVLASGLSPDQDGVEYTDTNSVDSRFYRVARTSLAPFESAGATAAATGAAAPGGSASRGSTVTVAITLPSTPPWPPANAPISSVTLGGISGTSVSDTTQGTVIATFAIPANASPGAQNVVVTFESPGPTYTLTGGFTVN